MRSRTEKENLVDVENKQVAGSETERMAANKVLSGHGEMKRYIRTTGNQEIRSERLRRHMDLWFTQKRANSQSSCADSVVCKTREVDGGNVQEVVILKARQKAKVKEGKVVTLGKEHVVQLVCEDAQPLEIGGEELWRLCSDPSVVFDCVPEDLERYHEIALLLSRQSNMLYVDDSYCDHSQLLTRIARARTSSQ